MINDLDAEPIMFALNELIATDGLDVPSFRRLGRAINQSHSTVASRFGSKEAMLGRVAECFADHYDEQLQRRAAWGGWEGFLPRTDDDHDWLRARAAWVEIGRGLADVGAACARLVRAEATLLQRTARDRRPVGTRGEPPDEWVHEAHLLLLGLWERLLATSDGIAPAEAQALWAARLRTPRLLSP